MGAFEDFLSAYAGYEMGQQGIQGARDTGQRGFDMATGLATDIEGKAEFKPFTVASTTGGRAVTDPTGGFTMSLSPEEQALQSQLFGGAGSMFGQAVTDPRQAQAALYEDIRAVQRPEEERKRLALEERMLSQGRTGLQSAAYGGSSPELLAQAQAEQEAMLAANLGARKQVLGEQKQAFDIGTGLFDDAYRPQNQLLDVLGAGRDVATIPANLQGNMLGLVSGLGQSGIESLIQGEDLANRLQLQQMQSLSDSLFGRQPTMQEQILGQIYDVDTSGGGSLLDTLGGLLSRLISGEEEEEEDVDIGKILQDALDAKGGQQ